MSCGQRWTGTWVGRVREQRSQDAEVESKGVRVEMDGIVYIVKGRLDESK